MGETLQTVIPTFNRSLRIESRADRLTADPGAVLLREILERSGIVAWMTARLKDPRSNVDVTHDLASLTIAARTSLIAEMKLTPIAPELVGKLADIIGAVRKRAPVPHFAESLVLRKRHRNRRLIDIQPGKHDILQLVSTHS